jgi:hypothetical protein
MEDDWKTVEVFLPSTLSARTKSETTPTQRSG